MLEDTRRKDRHRAQIEIFAFVREGVTFKTRGKAVYSFCGWDTVWMREFMLNDLYLPSQEAPRP